MTMGEYVEVWTNMSKFALMDFFHPVLIVISCLREPVVTYINEVYSLQEQANFILSMIAGSI